MLSLALGLPSLVQSAEPDTGLILFISLLGELDEIGTEESEDLISRLMDALAFTGEMIDHRLTYDHVPVPKPRRLSPAP